MHAPLLRRLSVAGGLVLALSACALAEEAGKELPPVLRSVEPNTADVAGGTKITIVGSGFDATDPSPLKVFVDGKPCTGVVVRWRGTRVTAIAPKSRRPGAVNVEVQNGDGPKATLTDALCYDDGKIWLAKWYRIKARAVSMWLLLKQGGLIMLLLAVLSVFGVAWAIHCAFVIRTSRIIPKAFLDRLSGQIARGETQQAIDSCQRDACVFSRVALAALRKAGETSQKIREAGQAAGSREASHLFQKISYLSNIGVISPMLGLLGTVIGMLLAFKIMGEEGARYMSLAGAIYKALGTTAAGLTIGIPAMACYYYFRGKLLRTVTDMEQVTEELSEALLARGEQE